ncbi:MAG: NADH-quinone oxidoreductase subunit L [Betaproteobacteria bacterium]|nr:NADH-quinone oxidoreductase subunit L [Betaproteobacteria bacterium]
MKPLYLIVPFAPLAGAIVAGLFGKIIGRAGAHWVTILGVLVSCTASVMVWMDVQAGERFNGALYTWITSGDLKLEIGFLIDSLTATMMVVVTFVSLLVHIYTIGYMHEDPGYQRFFSYISLFTFSMLMLVMANNFLQLFFGWEAVGLVSYLLIGFWYTRPTAIYANLKAFLVNRVGDFGFLLGIALIFAHFGTLDYAKVFEMAPSMTGKILEIGGWSLLTAICLCLFVGAMGKSAQFPLHVWLPDSMEGPTPISALIHAATMVTAGIFMVSRMSPLFELSRTALSVVLVIGGITALFMGLVAIVQNDIKRVVAYSTLSQLGYMTVALGASAYSAGMFHLVTHAFFKALLFLGAGSVIIGMHHEQDMRKMGGLRKYMPITYATMLVGALASAGVPGLAGFFSKDAIIEAAHFSETPAAGFAYVCVLLCVFVTALYTFRLIFMVFHNRHDVRHGDCGEEHGHHHVPHESPAVVTVPLILLAIPSVCAGWLIGDVLYGDYFKGAIFVAPAHAVLSEMGQHYQGVAGMMTHALGTAPFWLTVAGIGTAVYCYLLNPALPALLQRKFKWLHTILDRKYWFDEVYSFVFAGGARGLGAFFWKIGDVKIIDGFFVNGAARVVGWSASIIRRFQSGFVYHYAFMMIIGVLLFLSLWFARA